VLHASYRICARHARGRGEDAQAAVFDVRATLVMLSAIIVISRHLKLAVNRTADGLILPWVNTYVIAAAVCVFVKKYPDAAFVINIQNISRMIYGVACIIDAIDWLIAGRYGVVVYVGSVHGVSRRSGDSYRPDAPD
jgi:hypothetical protein